MGQALHRLKMRSMVFVVLFSCLAALSACAPTPNSFNQTVMTVAEGGGFLPFGICGSDIGVYDPRTRDSENGIPQGAGFAVGGRFAQVSPAVSFSQPGSLTPKDMSCTTKFLVTRSTTEISNSLNVGVSVDGSYDGGTGSGSDQFAYSDHSAHFSIYAMLQVMCHTPMEQSSGAAMKAAQSGACSDNYVNFRASYGQCFASGIQGASQFSLVIKQDASSVEQQGSNEAKLKGAMPAEEPTKDSVSGAVNITNSFASKLSNSQYSATSFSFGLDNSIFNYAAVTQLEQITPALDNFFHATRPLPIYIQTTPYAAVDSECVMRNAGCLSRIRADYTLYHSRLQQLVDTYTKAINDPDRREMGLEHTWSANDWSSYWLQRISLTHARHQAESIIQLIGASQPTRFDHS